MLRVIQNKSAESAKQYYSHSDYLSEGQELQGIWHGKAASMLGLAGIVQKNDFDRMCDNLIPTTGERLTLRGNHDRTVGYDFNFHLPKGVTLAYSLAGDERIVDAFRTSINETMEDIEADARTRVRKHYTQSERTTGNLAWAEFIHTTARPVDGVPDPHLHAHCFVFNVTHDEHEHCWKAGQFRELKRDASYYEASFHVRMAGRMRELGYEIRRDGKDWDITSFDPATTQKFSRRTDQIETIAKEQGITNAKDKDQIGAKSRAAKEKSYTTPELQTLWRDRLSPDETVTLGQIQHAPKNSHVITIDPVRESEAMLYAKAHCFERSSVVGKRQLLTEAMRRGIGEVSVQGIRRELLVHDIIVRSMHDREWATSREVLAEERGLIAMVRSGKDSMRPINSEWTIRRDILNADQRSAVQSVLRSHDQVSMICGGAGTGKTTLMKEAADGIQAGGYKLFTFAPSSDASRNVLRSEGFDATTVAELLESSKLQQEVAGHVMWIDEAGLLGTRTLKHVMEIAERGNCKLVLSGDWKQHGPVERGAAMRLLEKESGITPARVREIQRQIGEHQEQYRDIVQQLASGNTDDAIEKLDRMGWVHEIEDFSERNSTIAKDYAKAVVHGESVLALAPTYAEADQLTKSIRSELIDQGIVDKKDHCFTRLQPLRLTEAERTDPDKIHAGDVIVVHRKSKHANKGERFDAKSFDPRELPLHPGNFDVYAKSELMLACGDRIRITGNGQTKDKKHQLYNGRTYTIQGFTKSGDIQIGDGWVIDKNYGFIAPGYVQTSHASQGQTVKRVLIAESSISHGAASREQLYVSVSRGTHSCTIYTDDKLSLMDAVSRSESNVTATELVQGDATARHNRRKRAVAKEPDKTWEMVYE